MGVKVTNNGYGTISAGITSTATTITLDSGQGARFPTLGAGDYFFGTLVDTSNNIEIVKVTARSTDSMTVVRGQDNTTARAFAIGDRFELRPTAALFEDIITGAEVVNDTTPQLGGDLASNGNDINFGDNDKAQFGASNDLQIYHDGSASYITENGTGSLFISGTNMWLKSSGGDTYILCNDTTDAVSLYHNNVEKFATTSDGVINKGRASDFQKNSSASHRRYEFFDDVSLSTSNAALFSVTTAATHIAYYYEIIFYGGDWSGHSAARVIKRGFINGGNTYTGHNVVESGGLYASNMILDVSWSGTTSTVYLRLDTGSVTGVYYARLIGNMQTISIA